MRHFCYIAMYFLICFKLQIETLHFALQNHAYCIAKCSILATKMQGFAKQGHSHREAK